MLVLRYFYNILGTPCTTRVHGRELSLRILSELVHGTAKGFDNKNLFFFIILYLVFIQFSINLNTRKGVFVV
jgi:hypothetical protein